MRKTSRKLTYIAAIFLLGSGAPKVFSSNWQTAVDLNEPSSPAGQVDSGAAIPAEGYSGVAPVMASPAPDKGPPAWPVKKYNLFGGAPPIPGTRRIMADGEAPEEYKVEPGDTLFDICDQLLDEPGYWPKLWSLNPDIKNPHFIYPGMRLRFYPGDEENPPFLEVITEDDIIPVDKDKLKEEDLVVQDISGLLMEFTDPPATEVIGPEDLDTGFGQDIEAIGEYFRPSSHSIILPALVFADEIEPLGRVIIGPSGSELVGEGRRVILGGEGLVVGTTYLNLRSGEDVYSSEREFVGYRYEVISAIKVLQQLSDGDFLGKVVFNRLGAKKGDILTEYRSVIREMPSDLPSGSTGGQGNEIVGFGYAGKIFGGEGNVVLLEKMTGTIESGSTFKVFQEFRQRAILIDPDDLPLVGENVADVYILDTSTQVAIGFIFRARSEVRLGDSLGPKPVLE